MFVNRVRRGITFAAATAVMFGLGSAGVQAQSVDYGKVGGPVNLVIGYQPYYTEAWSGVVMRGKKFYEK
jgi:NitT/TauT family transport system substrate-binding protein